MPLVRFSRTESPGDRAEQDIIAKGVILRRLVEAPGAAECRSAAAAGRAKWVIRHPREAMVRRNASFSVSLPCRASRRAPGLSWRFGGGDTAEEVPQSQPRFVQLGLGSALRPAQDPRNFVVVVALHVMQEEDNAVTRRQLGDGSLQLHAVDRSDQRRVRRPQVWERASAFVPRPGVFIQRVLREPPLAHMHQDHIEDYTVEPGREGGFTAKRIDFSKHLQEGLLREIFGFLAASAHTKAQGKDAPPVEFVKTVEVNDPVGTRDSHSIPGRWQKTTGTLRRIVHDAYILSGSLAAHYDRGLEANRGRREHNSRFIGSLIVV